MKVFIQQPVIPEYRVSLFNELARKCEIEVHASHHIHGMPSSAEENSYSFKFKNHACSTKLGGRLFFQQNMDIPDYFNKEDILVYNSNPRFISNSKLIKQAKKKGMRLIAWNHSNSSTSQKMTSWIRKKITASKANDLLLYTESEVEIMQHEGWCKSNLYYLNNTIDERLNVKEIKSYTGTEKFLDAKKFDKVIDFKN